MSKKLSFTYPQITSYGGIANTLGILESYDITEDWIYSNYLQMIYYSNLDENEVLHEMTGSLYDLEVGIKYLPLYAYCPFFYVRSLNKELLFLQNDIIDYIIKLIDKEYYFISWVNHYAIPQSKKYHCEEFEDGLLIYGYDESQKCFFGAGFIDGKYKMLNLDFEILAEAIQRENDSNLYTKNVALIKFDPAYRYIFNINVLRSRVEDFLFSRDSEKRFALIDDKRYWFGLSYYDKTADQFINHFKDMRLIHNLVDQKTIMNNRLKYLASKKIIDNKQLDFLTKDNTAMLKKLVLLRNVTIKNNIKFEGNWPLEMVDSFLKQLKEVKLCDARFCEELLEIIK